MKANILDTARKKRLLKAEANRLLDNEAVKRCRKCQREMAKEADSMSKTHAALQSMHFLEITARGTRSREDTHRQDTESLRRRQRTF